VVLLGLPGLVDLGKVIDFRIFDVNTD
jgi:hypothetical protein